jgi:hypothetical protein
MIPTNSSVSTNGCDNISSNCVVWQGPDIACINLCSGDTISEVTSKLAIKVCDIITNGVSANPSLTGLDLKCLNISGTTPTTLVPVLQEMVNSICANNTRSDLPRATQVTNDLPIMTLPACLQYNDAAGNPVTELRLDLFAALIANQVCTNLSSITVINSTLTSYSSRLDVLEACVLPCSGAVTEVQIVPTCVSNIGTLTNVSVVVLALESAFCSLRTAVGLPAAINAAIAQSVITGSYTTLTTASTSYGSITGWNSSPSTLAQTVQNAWVVIDDMYTAISSIQTNCCPSGCDGITFGYLTTNRINASTNLIDGIIFDFTNSTVPAAFNDSSGFTKLTITDGLGASLNTTVSVSSLQNQPSGYIFPTTTLNTAQDLSIAVNYSFTDGVDTCIADQSSTVTGIVPCPASIIASSITSSAVTITLNNTLGTTAVYTIDILNSGNVVVATTTVNNPGVTVSHTFSTGLVAGTTYTGRVTVVYGGVTNVCTNSIISFTTTSAAAACSQGMDVAFIIDYTASMGTEIDTIKSGIAGVITTIDNASGSNNYRLGLVTADEKSGTTSVPNYNTSTDYLALPVAQRIINTGTGHRQFITGWELFQNNNTSTFTTQLNLLNSGTAPTNVPLGSGDGLPEPTDMSIGQVIESSAFLGAFRANVAKYLIVITDELPGGSDDVWNATDYAYLQSLTTTALNAGIKIFVLGAGTSKTYTPLGGTLVYPWREISTNTGGNWNVSEDPSTISSEIVSGCA